MRSATTFWSFLREFSPLELCGALIGNVLAIRFREPVGRFRPPPADRTQSSRHADRVVPNMLPAWAILDVVCPAQFVVAGTGSHTGQEFFRLASIRDWRAAFLPTAS